MADQFTVRGTITAGDEQPVPDVLVRVYDKDLPSLKRDELLGETATDEDGEYKIAFADDRFQTSERGGPDLYIEVVGRDNGLLGRSPARFNAAREERIDLTLERRPDRGISEYERLTALLRPLVEPLSLAELTAEDLDFLVQESDINRRRVAWLAAAARLARRTAVPAEAFYGWARTEPPLPEDWARVPNTRDPRELDQLLDRILAALTHTRPGRLLEALFKAIADRIIPDLRDRADDILRALTHALLVRRQALARLRDADTAVPLGGVIVRILDLEAAGEPAAIGRERTNDEGLFAITYWTDSPDTDSRRLRLEALDAADHVIWTTDTRIVSDHPGAIDFLVPVPRPVEPPAHALDHVAAAAQIELPPALLPFLAGHEIKTLGDIRRAGGLRGLAGLPVPADAPAIMALEAHADLSRMSGDIAANAKLIEKGFTSVSAVAAAPVADFMTAMHDTLGDFHAARLNVVARTQTAFMHNLITAFGVDRANGFFADTHDPATPPDPLPRECGCDDCEAAVSPAAYLADLIRYATSHLKQGGVPATLTFLEQTFHQPFGRLPTDCEAIDATVRQVRICIEVLRSYLAANPPTAADAAKLEAATRDYLLSTYILLLVKSGTSYEDVRLARSGSSDERAALAMRLGIDLTEPRPNPTTTPGDELDQLFLDPDAAATDPHALTERALERLFGLADTTRDPLSDGVKFGDDSPTPELTEWRFTGASWSRNTDREGLIYLRVQTTISGGDQDSKVEVFRDSARTELVAAGKAHAATGPRTVKLTAKNDSRLSGSIVVSGTSANNTDISISLVPKLLAWRLAHLRTIWREQDFPVDVFSSDFEPAADRRPIIDPDVIGPDDFRRPDATKLPFSLWRTRRLWVDQQLQDLQGITKTVVVATRSITVPDVAKVFARMYATVTYGTTTLVPWAATMPATAFDALNDTLDHGSSADIRVATARIATDLDLPVDAFVQIVRIAARQREWERDPKSEMVQADEWRDFFSLLVQAQKGRFFPAWITEEGAAPVQLGPEDFWRPLREPRDGEWPPAIVADRPLIDPDEVKLTDLPEPTIGQAAIQLWQTRRTQLGAETAAIRNERETNGFDAMLRFALGHPSSGNPLQHDLATIRTDLTSSTPAIVAAAMTRLRDLHLTLEAFNRVMTMKDQAAAGSTRPPTSAEWTELYGILTVAHKAKHLYPAWIAQETTAGLRAEYWRAVKARLAPGRGSADSRQQWLQGLVSRSRPAVVDPDLIDVTFFNGSTKNAALTIWQKRRLWIDNTIAAMAAKPTTLATLDGLIADTVSIPVAELLALDASRAAGESIQSRLDQLSLSNAAFVYLLKIRALVANAQPVTPSEWQNAYSILVLVQKRRLTAVWRLEEQAAGVTLSPDFFVPPDTAPLQPLAPALRWRTSQEDRFDWQDMLQLRVDQERSLIAAAHDVVSAVEESALPALRDALADAAGVGADLSAKASWVTDRLLIDAKAGGCQKTTRVAQAIETLQGLLFAARTSQSAVLQTLTLVLVAHDFDAEWRWIGSYATWRAAMFVWMYPENIAVGSLRRRQTAGFRAVVKAVRGARNLTPEQACAIAAEYATYYEDVARLAIGASAQAMVVERTGSACVPGVISKSAMVFLFGRGGVTNRLYWSTFKPSDTSGYAQSFWSYVPGAPAVSGIVGAKVYQRSATDRRIFLFLRTADHKLQFMTFDLETREWGGPTDLALPSGDARSCNIVVDQDHYYDYQPRLVIKGGGTFYFREMNAEGTSWEDGDWKKYELDAKNLNLLGCDPLYACVDGVMWVREGGQLEERYVAKFWSGTTTNPIDVNATYIGAVQWGTAKNAWNRWLVEKRTNGTYAEVCWTTGAHPISDGFPLDGLTIIAPNSGFVDHASYAYERKNERVIFSKLGKVGEADGVYLRLVELEATLTSAPARTASYRIAPRVLPWVAGQFSIPARLDGTAAIDARRNAVKLVLLQASDSATNRTYAEEAYYFVPMMLADGLRRSGEYVASLDWMRTVYDYAAPAGTQKIYYGLVQEESLPAVYKRPPDWIRDPLDPHAIAASRRLTYTRFTLLSIVGTLLDFADDEFTRDTAESVPRARQLYLMALSVLDLADLKQQLGVCTDIVGEIEIPLGPDVPPALPIIVGDLSRDLRALKDATTVAKVAVKVRDVLGDDDLEWDTRVSRARTLVDEAIAAEPLRPTVGGALAIGAAAESRAVSTLLMSPVVERAAGEAGEAAGAQFLSNVAVAASVRPDAIESGRVDVSWLPRALAPATARPLDVVVTPDLQPILATGGGPAAGLLNVSSALAALDFGPHFAVPLPEPPPLVPGRPVAVPSLAFCIPPNPLLASLRLHAELNLFKLRHCRNIAGIKRELDPYVAPIDTVTGLPSIGANGQLVLPGTSVMRPTLYRFAVLMQRAKELVAIAQQIETAMLSAIEKRDAEAYSMLRARQDLELATAGVELEVLRLKQANDGVTLASLQQARAQIQLDHYQKLLDEGLIELERGAIETLGEAAILQATAADLSFAAAAVYGAAAVAGAVAGGVVGSAAGGPLGTALGGTAGAVAGALSGGLGGVASAFSALSSGYSSLAAKRSTRAQIALTLASFERRRQEWELSASLAKQDVAIGAQQVTIAVDAVDIVRQEKVIAELRNTQAKDTVSFLANKFTNVDLYDWMSDVLEDVYSFFLQQATSTARVAEQQLAFERQEPLAGFVQADYWEAPTDSLPGDNLQAPVLDRRGLTGSARLLQDLYRLDQYSFDTNKRKLQLTKTISLALTVPTEFQRFRESGVMSFATPMAMFDADFPGHYLRLVRSVRTSVVALIPPTQGIHATLSTTGVSRVVIGPDVFQTVPIRRDPELVALTSPTHASGVFELEAQGSGMLLPFEGSGVDAVWELRMPKAANFVDYRTIGDVLLTIDYTALSSWDYGQQVIQMLRQSSSGDRPFSFRNQLADLWFDLHNPEQSSTPMTVRFRTVRDDFPPNLDALKIQQVVLFFARRSGAAFEVPVSSLRFVEEGSPGATGGAATTIDGIVSTRRGNAGPWMSFVGKRPVGDWQLTLPNTEEMRGRFTSGDIEDVLFVITFSGRTQPWPD